MRNSIRKYGGSYLKRLVAQFIGFLFYDKEYLKGASFSKSKCSIGWDWVLGSWFNQKIIGINADVPWPVNSQSRIGDYRNIVFNKDDLYIFQNYGIYFQAFDAKIIVGRNCHIGPNVGLITRNHDLKNPEKPGRGKDIVLGDSCWIGMNSVVMPGVTLGAHTVVGAGSIVTKSFIDGYVVIAGNPARIIKKIERSEEENND